MIGNSIFRNQQVVYFQLEGIFKISESDLDPNSKLRKTFSYLKLAYHLYASWSFFDGENDASELLTTLEDSSFVEKF